MQDQYDAHLMQVRFERDMYYKIKQQALNDRRCDNILSVTFDGNI